MSFRPVISISRNRIARARLAVLAVSDVDVHAQIDLEWKVRDLRRQLRARRGPGSVQCFSCHRFKPRPSSECAYCGDIPVTHNGCPNEFDREHGWEAVA